MDDIIELRAQCPHFRVLIIGRANAGKTTILKKVCNTTDEPRIYDPDGKEVWKISLSRIDQIKYISLRDRRSD
jgi:GTPase SAR1 family protein